MTLTNIKAIRICCRFSQFNGLFRPQTYMAIMWQQMCSNLFDKLRICQSSSAGMCRLFKWFSCPDVAEKESTMAVMGLYWQITFLSASLLISKLHSKARSAWCRPGKMVGLGPWCTLLTVWVDMCADLRVERKWDTLGQELVLPFLQNMHPLPNVRTQSSHDKVSNVENSGNHNRGRMVRRIFRSM